MKTMEEMLLEQIAENKKVQAISFVALAESGQIDAETASAHTDLFDEWQTGTAYKVGQIRKYNDVLYKVVQDHTSQADWLPSATPTLYEPIILTDKGYPKWQQPSGAHDAYNAGDIVDYNDTLYESLIDGNVHSPEAYPDGWKVYEEVA